MKVQTVDGKVYQLLDFTRTKFGKKFQKVERLTGLWKGEPVWGAEEYISDDSIIRFWGED